MRPSVEAVARLPRIVLMSLRLMDLCQSNFVSVIPKMPTATEKTRRQLRLFMENSNADTQNRNAVRMCSCLRIVEVYELERSAPIGVVGKRSYGIPNAE